MKSNNKNLFIAVLAVIGFIFLWDYFVVSRYGPHPSQRKQLENQTEQAAAPSTSNTSAFTPAPGQPKSIPAPAEEKEVVLQTNNEEVVLKTQGGRVVSWKVKEKDHWIELVFANKPEYVSAPLESFPELNFAVDQQSDKRVVLVADHPAGFRVLKELILDEKPYVHRVSLSFQNLSNNPVSVDTTLGWGPGINKLDLSKDEEENESELATTEAENRAVAFDQRAKSWQSGFIFGRSIDQVTPGNFDWAGVDNSHFLATFITNNTPISKVHVVANKKLPPVITFPIQLTLNPQELRTATYELYVGPKSLNKLNAVGYNLHESVDFGFFGVISKGLLKSLVFFKDLTGNYGWAIIILTICVQILFFPLTKKTLDHSLKMKKVQPHLKKLQAQYKSDPKRLQIETLNLYRKNGMKFMGMEGCFPMLLQIPIFFAFYQTLRVAYELRGAPWILWIADLAVYDPYYVLPIVMGAGMFLQQKLTSVAMDPAQAKMMLIMPIMFTFMFLKLPAGLVLYWCVNSIMTIVVQKILQLRKPPEPQAAS